MFACLRAIVFISFAVLRKTASRERGNWQPLAPTGLSPLTRYLIQLVIVRLCYGKNGSITPNLPLLRVVKGLKVIDSIL